MEYYSPPQQTLHKTFLFYFPSRTRAPSSLDLQIKLSLSYLIFRYDFIDIFCFAMVKNTEAQAALEGVQNCNLTFIVSMEINKFMQV